MLPDINSGPRPMAPSPDTIGFTIGMLRPIGPLLLVSIAANGENDCRGSSFDMPEQAAQAVEWAVSENAAGRNVYFTVNIARAGLNKKPTNSDITHYTGVWADCDPQVFAHGGYSQAREYLLGPLLDELTEYASAIFDTGHGLGAYLFFNEPIAIDQFSQDQFIELNKRAGVTFQGPSTFDPSRVMRLPGTVNYPTPSKLRKGYPSEPTMARLLYSDGPRYTPVAIHTIVAKRELSTKFDGFLSSRPDASARYNGNAEGLNDPSNSSIEQSLVSKMCQAGFELHECQTLLDKWAYGSVNGRSQGQRYWDRMWSKALEYKTRAQANKAAVQNAVTIDLVPSAPAVPVAALKPTIPVLTLAQLQAASANVTWSVKHILPSDSVGVLFGASGTFKSFVALDMALHVAHGLPWLGKKTKQGPVLYIAAEGGTGLWKRVQAWHLARGLDWTCAPFYTVPKGVMLNTAAGDVLAAAKAIGVDPVLVIVDTMSQTNAGEENSSTETAAYFRELGSVFRNEWRCTVLVIHHSGHAATERPRGSSAIIDNTDFVFGVFRDAKDMICTVACHKQKDGELFEDLNFILKPQVLGVDEDGEEIKSLSARQLDSAEELIQAIAERNQTPRGGNHELLMKLAFTGVKERDLRDQFYASLGDKPTNTKKQAFNRALDFAVKKGEIEVISGIIRVAQPVDNSRV